MADHEDEVIGQDTYTKHFDPGAYLTVKFSGAKVCSCSRDRVEFPLKCLHESFADLKKSSLEVIDLGSGPAIYSAISAAPYASEIVLSDIVEGNRDAMNKWLKNDPSAHDWTPYFDFVVKTLEGKGDQEARLRETEVRQAVKHVVYTDLNTKPPVDPICMKQYDVVITLFCLESAWNTTATFKEGIKNCIPTLLKPGGTFMLAVMARKQDKKEQGYYTIQSHKFLQLNVTPELAETALREAGFCNIVSKMCEADEEHKKANETFIGFLFLTAQLGTK